MARRFIVEPNGVPPLSLPKMTLCGNLGTTNYMTTLGFLPFFEISTKPKGYFLLLSRIRGTTSETPRWNSPWQHVL
jgi:hypothetical protein